MARDEDGIVVNWTNGFEDDDTDEADMNEGEAGEGSDWEDYE